MTEAAFNHLSLPPDQQEIRRVVQRVLVDRMVDRIVDPATPAPVRSRLEAGLAEIQVLVDAELADSDGAERIHLATSERRSRRASAIFASGRRPRTRARRRSTTGRSHRRSIIGMLTRFDRVELS